MSDQQDQQDQQDGEGTGATPPVVRDQLGRFLPGMTAYPRQQRAGERKHRQATYVDALGNALPPSELIARLEETYSMAKDTRSWRGMLQVLELYLVYIVGKPTQRVQVSSLTADLADLLRMAGDAPLLPADDADKAGGDGGGEIVEGQAHRSVAE